MSTTILRVLAGFFVALLLIPSAARGPIGLPGRAYAQENPTAQQGWNVTGAKLEMLAVQGNVYMLAGAGGNVTVQVGDDGVLLVDSSLAALSDRVVEEIKKLSTRPIRYIINTHLHPDHTGGNENIAKVGERFAGQVPGGGGGGGLLANVGTGAVVIAHENVLTRMNASRSGQPPIPFGMLPTDTFVGEKKTMFLNGEPFEILLQPNAHTDGDVMVFFRKSDVISAGDLFVTTSYPVIDSERGGNIQGIIAALNRIIDIAVPQFNQMGGTRVIPGHGRICNEADVVDYRDMVTIIRDRIQSMIEKGMTLPQVKAARPTRDYDGLYGATSGPWTTDMFIEAVYRDLGKA